MVADAVFVVISFGWHRLLLFFTNWTLLATIVFLILTTILHVKGSKQKTGLEILAIHHLLFEITAVFNLITMVVYWSMLHEETANSSEYAPYPNRIIHNYFVHIVPGVFWILNFFISDIIIKARHFLVFLPVVIVYIYMNYVESMKQNKALYSFWDWPNDFNGAILNIAGMSVGFLFTFFVMARITQYIKSDCLGQ